VSPVAKQAVPQSASKTARASGRRWTLGRRCLEPRLGFHHARPDAADGRWPLDTRYPGKMPVETDDGDRLPSRWNTLRALRVLDWYAARG
jgi:hypothetical protein